MNQYAWVNLTNVLWVEYPLGVGFSTTDNVTALGSEDAAHDFLDFLRNFQDVFSISNYKVYLTGESYAGRYVPYIASAMIDKDDSHHFDIRGAMIYTATIGQVRI